MTLGLLHHAVEDTQRTIDELRHYHATLQLALAAGLATGLCRQLEDLLRAFGPASAVGRPA